MRLLGAMQDAACVVNHQNVTRDSECTVIMFAKIGPNPSIYRLAEPKKVPGSEA